MINFFSQNKSIPYIKLRKLYKKALDLNQESLEAILIASYSQNTMEVNARLVNLKMIDNEEFIFFSNYQSPKSQEFNSHEQISAVLFWNKINIQIRMKAVIKKKSKEFNSLYFQKRSSEKNALAISSQQSEIIDSYESVKNNFKKSLELSNLKECPNYWGGYSFTPYYFEFWEGHGSRINKRDVYEKKGDNWGHSILQP